MGHLSRHRLLLLKDLSTEARAAVQKIIDRKLSEFLLSFSQEKRPHRSDLNIEVHPNGNVYVSYKTDGSAQCEKHTIGRLREHLEPYFDEVTKIELERAGNRIAQSVWGLATELRIHRDRLQRSVLSRPKFSLLDEMDAFGDCA